MGPEEHAEIARRIDSIEVADRLPPEPERPRGLDPSAVYRVQIGTINVRRAVQIPTADSVLHAMLDGDYVTEWITEPLACPLCQIDGELTLQGRWGAPATVLCPCGYQWPLAPSHSQWSARQLQAALVNSAAQNNGLPTPPPSQ